MKTENANPPPLLTYTVSTTPSPLQVSSSNYPSPGMIAFVLTPNAGVLCKLIEIAIPIGNSNNELFSETPSYTINTENWSVSQSLQNGSSIGLIPNINYSVITLKNVVANFVVDAFTLQVNGNVNTIQDTATVVLNELSTTTSNPNNFTQKSTNYPMTKAAAPSLFINNFISSLSSTPNVPATEFTLNQAFQLSWESNGTYFKIFEKGNTTPIYSGTALSYTVSNGLSTDTTFILAATMDSGTMYEAITVTISNPALTPTTVVSSGNATIGGNLATTGNSQLNTLAVGAQATFNGSIAAQAAVSMANTLSVTGATTLNQTTVSQLNVTGNATVTENLNVASITIGSWTISSDANGNLNFSKGGNILSFSQNNSQMILSTGTLAANVAITLAGNNVITDNAPIWIESPGRGAALNATDHSDLGGSGEVAAAYWMGLSPDGDSNLKMHLGNPW